MGQDDTEFLTCAEVTWPTFLILRGTLTETLCRGALGRTLSSKLNLHHLQNHQLLRSAKQERIEVQWNQICIYRVLILSLLSNNMVIGVICFSRVAEFRGGFRGVSSRLMGLKGLLDVRFCEMLLAISQNFGWLSKALSKGPAWSKATKN